MTDSYDKIIPTAWIVAYRRTFSDIPYSQEIFKELNALRSKHFFDVTNEMLAPQLSPQYEARHKILNTLINAEKNSQILEIASGFSSRGMEYTEFSNVVYVEFDLPKVIADKSKIVKNILKIKGKSVPRSLFFVKGNALQYATLKNALAHFKKKPITIVNEGLLRYLNFTEKEQVAKNIYKILREYGGCWITTDITLKKLLGIEKKLKSHNKKIIKMTGINFEKNCFNDEAHAVNFFERLGFSIERHTFGEAKALISPKKLDISQKEVNTLVNSALVYVLRAK